MEYTGSMYKKLFHGPGLLKFPDDSVYEGEFKLGLQHGYGEKTWNLP